VRNSEEFFTLPYTALMRHTLINYYCFFALLRLLLPAALTAGV